MAIIMTRFCCCKGINLRVGGIVVGILSLIGSGIMLAMTISTMVWTGDKTSEIDDHDPKVAKEFTNTTIKHFEETLDLELWSLTMDVVSMIVAVLLIYGVIKRIRLLLYTYIVWTIITLMGSFGGLIWFSLQGPRLVVAIFIFQFALQLGTAIYFMLVVYSYSELVRQGGELQALAIQEPAKGAQGLWEIKSQYSRFGNEPDDPGMGNDREKLTV